MDITMETLVKKFDVINSLAGYKKVYFHGKEESQFEERIKYRIDSNDWIVYIDGNTFRDFIRGFAICSSGFVGCDDKGDSFSIELNKICNVNISNTSKSLLIDGHSISIGEVSCCLAEKLICIRKEFRRLKGVDASPVRMASFPDKLWYIGYNEQILGPYSEAEVRSYICAGEFNLDAMLVWSSSMKDWEFVKNVPEFSALSQRGKDLDKKAIIIDINNCTIQELLKLPGMSHEKAEQFLERRLEGIWVKNIYELQKEFDLKPHELDYLTPFLVFKIPVNHMKSRRVLDI